MDKIVRIFIFYLQKNFKKKSHCFTMNQKGFFCCCCSHKSFDRIIIIIIIHWWIQVKKIKNFFLFSNWPANFIVVYIIIIIIIYYDHCSIVLFRTNTHTWNIQLKKWIHFQLYVKLWLHKVALHFSHLFFVRVLSVVENFINS